MENVQGILSAKEGPDAPKGSVINKIINDIKNPQKAMALDKKFTKELSKLGIKLSNEEYVLYPFVESLDQGELFADQEDTHPKDFLIKSEEHGIPQTRHRVIICGIKKSHVSKKGLPRKINPPKADKYS